MKSTTIFLKRTGILFFVFTFLLASCKVQFVADYNAELAKQVDNTTRMVDNFYLSMLEKTKNSGNDRAFSKFVDDYIKIEVELNSLLTRNKVRPLNQNSTRICEITLQLWNKYKNEHKTDNTLSDGLIRLNQKSMSDLFYAMQVAEQAKKIASSPTNQ